MAFTVAPQARLEPAADALDRLGARPCSRCWSPSVTSASKSPSATRFPLLGDPELKRAIAGLGEAERLVHGDAVAGGVEVDHPGRALIAEPGQQRVQAGPRVAAAAAPGI